jgi:demethylspheroidene O-methyltransferase
VLILLVSSFSTTLPWVGWQSRLIASRKFQTWAAGFPLTRRLVRREGEALFDLLAGFCHSQILTALVKFEIPQNLMTAPTTSADLAVRCDVPPDRMDVLLRAAGALGLLKSKRAGRFALTRTGAALVGVPGLAQMISHHDVLYRDLSDPVKFFRGEVATELANFWPYVFGGGMAPDVAETYSDLMANSQILVAEDTLRAVDFGASQTLLDVGGGSGAFLAAVGAAHPAVQLMLFDLPQVAPSAAARFADVGMTARAQISTGSFRTGPLPTGADTISLIRVLYDHTDDTVADLLAKCYAALPVGGRLVISEPMSGGVVPERAGDAYFALYTMAMRTGKARSADEIAALCVEAGFGQIIRPKSLRPFVTKCVVATKSSKKVSKLVDR